MVNEVESPRRTRSILELGAALPRSAVDGRSDPRCGASRSRVRAVRRSRTPSVHVLFEAHTRSDERRGSRCGSALARSARVPSPRGKSYDAILFYTYIYEPTAAGLPLARSARAHLRPRTTKSRSACPVPRALPAFARVGSSRPRSAISSTRDSARAHPERGLGIGLDPPPCTIPSRFREHIRPARAARAYLGSERGKAVDELTLTGSHTARAAARDRSSSRA